MPSEDVSFNLGVSSEEAGFIFVLRRGEASTPRAKSRRVIRHATRARGKPGATADALAAQRGGVARRAADLSAILPRLVIPPTDQLCKATGILRRSDGVIARSEAVGRPLIFAKEKKNG